MSIVKAYIPKWAAERTHLLNRMTLELSAIQRLPDSSAFLYELVYCKSIRDVKCWVDWDA